MERGIWVLLALTCVVHTVWCQLDPEIVDEIIPEVNMQGGSAMLNCTVVNVQEGHKVIWTFLDAHTGGEIISNDANIFQENKDCKEGKKKYEISRREVGRRITFSLTINCLSVMDYGYYKCYIQISGSGGSLTWPSKIGSLIVQVPPTITSKNDAVMQLDIGQNATLECTASGVPEPNITWVRADGSMLPGGMGALHRNSTLDLYNIKKEDRGLYKCVADNQVRPPDQYLVAVNVFFKPETVAVQNTVGQAQNKMFHAKLECLVSGYPEPEVTWYREPTNQAVNTQREKLNDNEKYDISKQIATTILGFGQSWYTLRIKNVEANDFTKYFCNARNRIGSNNETMIDMFETIECQGANCPSYSTSGASSVYLSLLICVVMTTVAKIVSML